MLYFQCDACRTSETLRYIMYGKYAQSGFVFVKDKVVTWFGTRVGMVYSQATKELDQKTLETLEFLLLSVEDEEVERLYKTCEACAKSKIPFNLYDLLLIHVPFRDIQDIPLFEVRTLNNAQSIILILRECLLPEHPIRAAISELHSRQTFVETLHEILKPLTIPVVSSSLIN
jgi:hypothetical protein